MPGMRGSTLPGQPIRVDEAANGISFAQYVLPCIEKEVADAPAPPSGTVVRVYLDANCNSAQDEGEAFAAGAVITVVLPNGQTDGRHRQTGRLSSRRRVRRDVSSHGEHLQQQISLRRVRSPSPVLPFRAIVAIQNWFIDEENGLRRSIRISPKRKALQWRSESGD